MGSERAGARSARSACRACDAPLALRAPGANLAGPAQENPRERGRALGGTPLEYFAVDAKPRARGRVAIVPARPGVGGAPSGPAAAGASGPSLASRAAAAAEA